MASTQLLPFRPERDVRRPARIASRPVAPSATTPRPSIEPSVMIHCAGQDFRVKRSMAEIFLRHARSILSSGASELTPLLHAGGVELVLISPTTAVACLVDGNALVSAHRASDPALSRKPGFSH